VAHVIERPEHPSPTWTRVARVKPQTTVYTVGNLAERTDYQFRVCAENVEGAGPPLTLAAAAQSLCVHACSDIFVSFRHRTFSESKPVTFTSLMPCRHAYNVKNTYIWTSVSIQLSVSIHIISVSLHAFFK